VCTLTWQNCNIYKLLHKTKCITTCSITKKLTKCTNKCKLVHRPWKIIQNFLHPKSLVQDHMHQVQKNTRDPWQIVLLHELVIYTTRLSIINDILQLAVSDMSRSSKQEDNGKASSVMWLFTDNFRVYAVLLVSCLRVCVSRW